MAEQRDRTDQADSSQGASRGQPPIPSALERLQANPLMLWLSVLALTLVAFYLMDHLIMAGQGLPLNLDLSPAQ